MTWLMLAKMPLLMSSRMMSAALTPMSSASSLTMIEDGISTAPRADGSMTWTAPFWAPSVRRWGFRGPRVLRVPLRLRAMTTSVERHEVAMLEPLAQLGVDGDMECPFEGGTPDGELPAGGVGTQVGAPAVGATGGVEHHLARRGADDPHQLTLRPLGATRDAGALGDGPRGRGGGSYDATSVGVSASTSALAALVLVDLDLVLDAGFASTGSAGASDTVSMTASATGSVTASVAVASVAVASTGTASLAGSAGAS